MSLLKVLRSFLVSGYTAFNTMISVSALESSTRRSYLQVMTTYMHTVNSENKTSTPISQIPSRTQVVISIVRSIKSLNRRKEKKEAYEVDVQAPPFQPCTKQSQIP